MPLAFGGNELDIVFVIDESGSMWGSKQHPKANDKYRHRASIVENVITRLAEQAKGTSQVYHVSVIEFGGDKPTSARVLISNLQLKYNPAKPDEIISQTRLRVSAALYRRTQNMGNTNTPLAMKLALAEFRKLEAANGGVARERKLLIITDGRPYIYNENLKNLRNDIQNYADDLKSAKVELWLVGLNDASNYWNTGDGEFWENVAGIDKARLAETSFPSIAAVVQDIVDHWLHQNSISLANEEYHSRPYLKRITFNVHSHKPGAKSQLIDPNGQPIPPENGTGQQGTYIRYIVDNPIVGTYTIKKLSNSAYKVFVEENAPTLIYIGPQGMINQNVKNRIVFQVMQGENGLQEIPQWPVTAKVSITPPSGIIQTLPATFKGDGKYSATWIPTEVGKHQLKFEATVEVQTDKGPKQYELVDGNSAIGEVEVQAYTPPPGVASSSTTLVPKNALWLHLETPNLEDGLSLLPWEDRALVKFSLYKGEELVTTLGDVVNNPDSWLKLELMDKSGIALSKQPIPLKVEDSYFVAEIPIKRGWSLSSNKLHLRVTAEPHRLREDNLELNGIWLPESLEDKRIYGNPMTVADIDVVTSVWVMVVVAIIIIILVLALIALGLVYIIPRLNIRSEDRGRIVNLLIYDGIEDPSAVRAKKINITGQIHSKLDGQVRVTTAGKSLAAEYFRVSRSPNPNSPQVKIEYRWQGEDKKKVHRVLLSGRTPKRVEGISSGNYMIALGY